MSIAAMNFSTVRKEFKGCCDRVCQENQTLIVTRKNEQNVVILSQDEYNRMLKAMNNAAYLAMLHRSEQEATSGALIPKTLEELEELAQ